MIKEQNQSSDMNNQYKYNLQKYKTTAEQNRILNIETYEELFSTITTVTHKFIIPTINALPNKNGYSPFDVRIQIGKIYKIRDNFEETLYFIPAAILDAPFISHDEMLGLSTYDLKEIFYNLYTPEQILSNIYKILITIAKNT